MKIIPIKIRQMLRHSQGSERQLNAIKLRVIAVKREEKSVAFRMSDVYIAPPIIFPTKILISKENHYARSTLILGFQ